MSKRSRKKFVDLRRTFLGNNLKKHDSEMKGDVIRQRKEYVSWCKCTPTPNSESTELTVKRIKLLVWDPV